MLVTNNPFELSYKKKIMGIRSVGLSEIILEAHQKLDGFSINLATFDNNRTERSIWIQNESLTNNSFIIEGRPTGSQVDCYGERLDELEPVQCKGSLIFK